jgi:hypothetical protein
MVLRKVVSGCQTGADIAGQDAAIAFEIESGGWVPRGRINESGKIPLDYKVQEADKYGYKQRTEWNIRDSDGTIIFTYSPLSTGSLYTYNYCKHLNKPCKLVFLDALKEFDSTIQDLKEFIIDNKIQVLNVAGSREGKHPGIYREVRQILLELFELVI